MSTVLFDMDCTLTPARKKIETNMIRVLSRLLNLTKVGIVTGSGFNYIEDQLGSMWDSINCPNLNNLTLYPCNGTKHYEWNGMKWVQKSDNNMMYHVGLGAFQELLRNVVKLQLKAMTNEELLGESLVFGHFTSNSGSLLNWCMIGRDATEKDRKIFEAIDEEKCVRTILKSELDFLLEASGSTRGKFTTALGGKTSVDIYPIGWNKTFTLKNFYKGQDVYFIGDNCVKGGNDHEIYEEVLQNGLGAFQTSGPEETIKLIEEHIIPNL